MNRKLTTIAIALATILVPAIANADTGDPSTVGILAYLMAGKYIPAVGGALVLIVQLIKMLPIAWFKTKPGGYVLGFGSAALVYGGGALYDGAGFSLGIIGAALAAGWAAAGGWEHISDLISWLKPPVSDPLPVAAGAGSSGRGVQAALTAGGILITVSASLLAGSLVMQACAPVKHAGEVVVDCTTADAAQTAALVDELKPLLAGQSPDWQAIEGKAIAAGVHIGGCVLANLVQDLLSSVRALPVNQTWEARGALEDFRAKYANGATFHTARGDL